jgi:hypothetical protein
MLLATVLTSHRRNLFRCLVCDSTKSSRHDFARYEITTHWMNPHLAQTQTS